MGFLLGLALFAAQASLTDDAHSLQMTSQFVEIGNPRSLFEFVVQGVEQDALEAFAKDPARIGSVFSVEAIGKEAREEAERPALLGSYRVDLETGAVRFRSRFPAEPGVSYRSVYRAKGSDKVTCEFSIAEAAGWAKATRVVAISPSGDVLPENLLKFYISFSRPMSRGEAYEHLRLLDANGKALDLPFLELGEELWDTRAERFTLLFDPGRIKTGLKPREELGPVLEAGKSYTLVVDRGWRDASGKALGADFRKAFRAGAPDLSPPDPKSWIVRAPAADTRGELSIRFPEPLDRGLLGHAFVVMDRAGKPIAGKGRVGEGETSWSFVPDAPWASGVGSIVVDTLLEDLAGNSIGRAFEVDVFERVDKKAVGKSVRIPFVVERGIE